MRLSVYGTSFDIYKRMKKSLFVKGDAMKTRVIVIFGTIVLSAYLIFAGGPKMILKVGDKAPEFTMVSSTGDTVRLNDYSGKNSVVLIFYPGDETPGCTKQLCAVRDDYSKFETKAVKVFGVNPAGMESHQKFVKRYGFQFPLLIDEKSAIAKLYGCEFGPMVKRTVYAIDPQGKIVYVKQGMPSDDEILAAIPEKKK